MANLQVELLITVSPTQHRLFKNGLEHVQKTTMSNNGDYIDAEVQLHWLC